MRKEYGKLINETWDFYFLLFTHDEKPHQGKHYPFPDGSGANNHPGHDRLILDGYRLVIPPTHDQATHKLVVGSYSIIDADTMRQDITSRSDQEIRDTKLAAIKSIADAKIEVLVPNGEKNRWETRGLRLAWKRIKHLKSPGNNQDLTSQEEELADQLDTLGESTEAIREARDSIRIDINNASGQALKDIDSTITNPYWP